MFEDLQKFLEENRKEPSHKEEPTLSNKDKAGIIKHISDKFGVSIEDIEEVGDGVLVSATSRMGGNKATKGKITGLAESLSFIATSLGISPKCVDCEGTALKAGDTLLCSGGKATKKVLKVGFGFANLSHTEDQAVDDGVWFETEMRDLKFKKK